VTTETVKTAPVTTVRKAAPAKRKVVRKTTRAPARATVVEKTTTTVTNR
jgi:colicin import membrane protein